MITATRLLLLSIYAVLFENAGELSNKKRKNIWHFLTNEPKSDVSNGDVPYNMAVTYLDTTVQFKRRDQSSAILKKTSV